MDISESITVYATCNTTPFTCICLAFGEDCMTTSDCQVTQCSGSNAVVCELPSDGGSGKCTCAVAEG